MDTTQVSGPDLFGGLENFLDGSLDIFYAFLDSPVWPLIKFSLVLVAAAATIIIIYLYIRIETLEHHEHEKIKAKIIERKGKQTRPRSQTEWEQVMTYIEAGNEAEWRLAILEADNILDSVLTELGYAGEGVGDKLKLVDPGHMKSLDLAWEAHKVRNRIAHDGSAFRITYREARRVIAIYEQLFREFGYI